MDTQRYNQRVAEHQTETRVPELKTACQLKSNQEEVDGVKVYSVTHTLISDQTWSMNTRYTKVDAIPEKYIMARWRRDVLPRSVFSIDARCGVDHSAKTVMRNDKLQGMKDEVLGNGVGDASHDGVNEHVIANLLRVPEEIEGSCSNPQGIRNKGCATNRRLVGPGEKAANRKKKTTRQCKTCFEFVSDHDSRNCPLKNKEPAP
ncbi:hypothetical protein M8C21_012538 [Ambrosia artemisiifolia]|uniref:Protein FAR1-RELATED SEQUENCE n=1 Tax=Ambrosia artemisiifolia TaxID=4212 RepID=A0AAD5C2B4_AMBAR|nr:hypothetical protein M8C21_012538 [Ambrosia artemisiifolia]